MPNIGSMLKEEISRISRKQSRAMIEPLKKQVSAQRSALSALKQENASLRREVAALQKAAGRAAPATSVDADAETGGSHRFSAAGFKSLRGRLGLSAEAMGRLLDVSGQSVYNWERGAARPRPKQVARIAALRSAGKRSVRAMLEESEASAS
jgi:DNA-binding transcriptional regulator YiaG